MVNYFRLQKVIGVAALTFSHTFLATLIVGCVPTVGGFVMAKARGAKLITDLESVLGSCLFGVFATLATVLSFAVFLYGGDVGVNTFIMTLSIIPGALIDRIFFKHKLSVREWLGVGIAIFAGHSILGWPSLKDLVHLPVWVWLSLGAMMSVAVNQGITQKIKKIDPFVKNFWGGATTFWLALICLLVVHCSVGVQFVPATSKLLVGSAIVGFIVIGMWSFNLMSYKGGAQIAIKKLVMNGSYLIMAMFLGILVFGEALTLAKVIGALFYFAAFSLMDKGTYQFFKGKIS